MAIEPGTRIGAYEVVGSLGRGGMGEVYRARDLKLGREVALKTLPDAFARDPDRLARFRREAQVLASLNHPNIGAIYGLEDEASAPPGRAPIHALVLELVEGPTLAELIAGSGQPAPAAAAPSESSTLRQTQGRPEQSRGASRGAAASEGRRAPRALSLDDALPIARQVIDALEAAHAVGIVHRDLKPANIKVRPDGTVKVLDFGLAKLGDAIPSGVGGSAADLANSPTLTSPAMTQLGMILGTAGYMAPEQAKGRVVDKRADIWAFGCILYEMLTGQRAFDGDDVSDTLANILKTEPQWTSLPANLPPAIKRLIRRCLSKDPAMRLPDIGVARLEIAEALLPPDPVDVAQASSSATSAPRSAAWWRLATIGALLIAVATGVVAFRHLREVPTDAATVRFSFGPPAGTSFPSSTSPAPPVISPNGRQLLYRARHQGEPFKLWIRSLDSFETHVLEGTDGAALPFWGPSGTTIGFMSESKIKTVDVAGGRVQVLCDIALPFLGADWSRDGTILFGAAGGLFRVAQTGGSPVPVTTVDPVKGELVHIGPSFLSDGKRFLFNAVPGNITYLASLDAPSSRKEIRKGDSNAVYANGFLLSGRQDTVVAQRFDEANGVLSGDPIPIAAGVRAVNSGAYAMFSASETGVLFYEGATSTQGGKPVWVDRHGAEIGPATALDEIEFPRFSPDGRTLAMVQHGDVWVQDLSGRPAIKLTFDGLKDEHFAPLWSADGKRLVYESTAPAPLRSLPADASTSAPTAVSPSSHLHPHGWTPSGDLLAVVIGRAATNLDIVTFPLGEKSELKDVVATPANEGGSGAALSPDGRWLAYSANPTERLEIWVRPFPGPGAPIRVSGAGGTEPVWSRNGRELFYVEDGDKLMATTVQPGTEFRFSPPVQLFVSKYIHGLQPPTYDVAPDGRFVMLKPRADASATTLNVIVNWVQEVERRATGAGR